MHSIEHRDSKVLSPRPVLFLYSDNVLTLLLLRYAPLDKRYCRRDSILRNR